MQALCRHDWVVYAKTPLAGSAAVLQYLSRYTHKRVRHYGLLAPAAKAQRLALARSLLRMPPRLHARDRCPSTPLKPTLPIHCLAGRFSPTRFI